MTDDWREGDDRNVFQMIEDAGGPGIWVRRTTWESSCARIVAMGEVTKPPPYYGNPTILMDVYSLSGDLRDELANLDTAGTFKTWREITAPDWASTAPLRPHDDPAIGAMLSTINKKRGKAASSIEENRIMLNVSFARKNEAKALGARWDPKEKRWWLSEKASTKAKDQAQKLGFIA